jgi:hypothetical protein
MGHDVPGMRSVYSHVSDAMRAELTAALQERWAASLRERAQLASRSSVPILDVLLAEQAGSAVKIGSQNRTRTGAIEAKEQEKVSDLQEPGGAEAI